MFKDRNALSKVHVLNRKRLVYRYTIKQQCLKLREILAEAFYGTMMDGSTSLGVRAIP